MKAEISRSDMSYQHGRVKIGEVAMGPVLDEQWKLFETSGRNFVQLQVLNY
jgi:hypothetical protein